MGQLDFLATGDSARRAGFGAWATRAWELGKWKMGNGGDGCEAAGMGHRSRLSGATGQWVDICKMKHFPVRLQCDARTRLSTRKAPHFSTRGVAPAAPMSLAHKTPLSEKKTPSSFYDAPTLHSHADGGPKHRAGAQARFVDVKREKKPTSKPWNCNALVPLASKGTDAAHTPSDSSRQVLPQRPMNRHPFLSSR